MFTILFKMSLCSELNSWKFLSKCDLTGYTVIVPSVAVGNVSQLTCDLLISSLQMKKVSSIYSTALIPVLGYDPYTLDSNSLCSSCEMYTCSTKKIAVIQFRSPLVCKYAKDFLNYIVKHLIENKVKELIVLTSSFAHEKKHVMTSPFRYFVNELYGSKAKFNTLKWMEHEMKDNSLVIYGGGFATLLFNICQDKMPCLVLYKYCSEGDNVPDAYEMIEHLSKVVSIFSEDKDINLQIVQPISWKLLFGKPPPLEIY